MSHENDSEDDADDSPDDDHSEGDRLSFRFPFPIGGGFTVSGPNASKLWGKFGWALIIVATGLVFERIASVFLKLFDNGA